MNSWFRFGIDDLHYYATMALAIALFGRGMDVLAEAERDSLVNKGILFVTVVMASAYLQVVLGPLLSRCISRFRERFYSPISPVEREEDDSAATAPSLTAS